MLFSLRLSLFFCPFSFLLVHAQQTEKPKAVVHVGPYKTGTSWFQGLCAGFKKQLENSNYYSVLLLDKDIRYLQNLELARCVLEEMNPVFTHFKNLSACENTFQIYNETLNRHLSKGHNIFLTSEAFSSFIVIPKLLELLNGFEVSIIIVYRDYVNIFLSLYNQLYATGIIKIDFPAFLKSCYMTEYCHPWFSTAASLNMRLSAVNLVKTFSEFIDINHIKVFDYNGMRIGQIDEGEAIFRNGFPGVSDAFKAEITKKINEKIALSNKQVNSRKNVINMNLLNIAVNITQSEPNNTSSCAKNFKEVASSLRSPPLHCADQDDFTRLVKLALEYDKELREKFSSIIFYANEAENHRKIYGSKDQEELCSLDENKIVMNDGLKEKILHAFEKCEKK